MDNNTVKYHYFVSYFYFNANQYGFGYSNIIRENQITSIEDLRSVSEIIEKDNGYTAVSILNFKKLKTEIIKNDIRCEKCVYFQDNEYSFPECRHDKHRIEHRRFFRRYFEYLKVSPLQRCRLFEKKEGAENETE